jgi:hypothetical protein
MMNLNMTGRHRLRRCRLRSSRRWRGGNIASSVVFIRFNPHDLRADGKLQHVLPRDRRMHLLNVL